MTPIAQFAENSTNPVARAAIVEKYRATQDKLFMSLNEAGVLASELANRLINSSPRPEVIVGIETGGLFLAYEVARLAGLPLHTVRLQRKGTTAKGLIGRLPYARPLAAWLYQYRLGQILMYSIFRNLEGLQNAESLVVPERIHGRNVGVIDDCVESGATIGKVREVLLRAGAASVTVACLSWNPNARNRLANFAPPEIYIGHRIQHYPWSANSPDWDAHQSAIEKIKKAGL